MSLLDDVFDKVTMREESAERIRQELIRRSLEGTPERRRRRRFLPRTAALVIFAAAILMTAAFAAVAITHEDFFRSAFGTGISTEPVQLYSVEGNPIDMPEAERVEVDSEVAEELVGEYVLTVGQSFTAHNDQWQDVTFTIDSLLVDKNGMGVMTYTVTGQNLDYTDAGYGTVYGGPALGLTTSRYNGGEIDFEELFANNGNNGNLDCWTYKDAEASSDGEVRLVTYFASVFDLPEDFALYVSHNLTESGVFDENADTVLKPEYLPGLTLTAENGDTAEVSPVGLRVNFDAVKAQYPDACVDDLDSIVIHFKDGSEYVVTGGSVSNFTVGVGMAKLIEGLTLEKLMEEGGMWLEDAPSSCYTFNRLVDIEDIADVTVVMNVLEWPDPGDVPADVFYYLPESAPTEHTLELVYTP